MSEYQFYEFRALDRPLTQKQMAELRRVSSRAHISADGFVNEYNYGDLKADPRKLLGKYFDAFLYLAKWGTRWLMLRLPSARLNAGTAAGYNAGDAICCRRHGSDVIVSFLSEDEEAYEWAEGDGWLTSLVPIRAALMRGDHRALYLGWLVGVQAEEIDEEMLEPAVPPGLDKLDVPLTRFVDFLRIDGDLIAAAAGGWRAQSSSQRRTAAELLEGAHGLGEARRKKEAARRMRQAAARKRAAAARRKKKLESLKGREKSLWDEVDQHIGARLPKRYGKAVLILRDLRDLAEMKGKASAFTERMEALRSEHSRKTTFMARLIKAKLVD